MDVTLDEINELWDELAPQIQKKINESDLSDSKKRQLWNLTKRGFQMRRNLAYLNTFYAKPADKQGLGFGES